MAEGDRTLGDKILVAAIDFGTTFSGYAFSLRHEYEQDRMKIFANTSWIANGSGLVSWKTPTTLLLNKDQTFYSFGYQAENDYHDLLDEEEAEGWYYFSRFKMLLHTKQELSRDVVIPDIEGKPMPARTVFSLSIEYLKNHLFDKLKERNLGLGMKDILWVLTVPAIWNEPAKQFMREAATMAGIDDASLVLALEPEAASLFCKYLPTEKMDDGEKKTKIVPFQVGTKYMVLDLGGGTADVTVHQVVDEDKLMELYKATGGAWGGTKVDEEYLTIIKELYGEEVFERFQKENRPDLLDFLREFELSKRNKSVLKSAEQKPINVRFPAALHGLYEERSGKDRNDAIDESRFKGSLKFKRDKLSFDASVFRELFKGVQESIISHIKTVLQEPSNEGVSAIIMVGGFSDAKIITEAVREEFNDLRVIVPEEAGLAVVKGAVLYGHDPLTIVSRVCKFTYGVAVRVPFDNTVHPSDKKETVNGEDLCNDAFSKFVQIGECVSAGENIIKQYDVTQRNAPVMIKIYASTEKQPVLTTGPDCSLMGTITINPPQEGWPKNGKIQVEMGFGGTEFTVSARDADKIDESYEASFDFLGDTSNWVEQNLASTCMHQTQPFCIQKAHN